MARLFLIPNALDLGCEPVALDAVLPRGAIVQAAALSHWIVEDAKSARAFIKRVGVFEPLSRPLQSMDIRVLPRPVKGGQSADLTFGRRGLIESLIEPLTAGADMGLLSDAGLPAVADPGSEVVALAHRVGATVVPLSGPSSLMLALAASGLQGQSFAFVGYLPQDAAARALRLRELQARSEREGQTQLLIETPYRNAVVMAALLEHLSPPTRLGVACGLTLPGGWCRTATVAEWRQARPSFDGSLPAVFSFLA